VVLNASSHSQYGLSDGLDIDPGPINIHFGGITLTAKADHNSVSVIDNLKVIMFTHTFLPQPLNVVIPTG